MAWLNPRIDVKPNSQLINKLMVVCSDMAAIMALGLQTWARKAALRPKPRTYHYKQSLTYNN